MKRKIIKAGRVVSINVALIFTALTVILILFAFYTNVPTQYDTEDKDIFERKLHLEPFRNPRTFAEEIVAIKTLQHRTFSISPLGAGIPEYQTREPADFIARREGLCFDRSRTTDKALSYMGLSSRHVYLLYQDGSRSLLSALFHRRQPSHAVTEVKTRKGWMFIDSNTDWVALTRDGHPVSADEVYNRAAEFETFPSYLKQPWWAFRGIYSRRGQLYPPYIFFPDVNWPDFISWILFG